VARYKYHLNQHQHHLSLVQHSSLPKQTIAPAQLLPSPHLVVTDQTPPWR